MYTQYCLSNDRTEGGSRYWTFIERWHLTRLLVTRKAVARPRNRTGGLKDGSNTMGGMMKIRIRGHGRIRSP